VLTAGNQLLPFWIIDLRCGSGYLRVISPHQRIPLARKILLADDSVTAQNMGRKILADAGYEVITVNNGSAALKKIAEAKPDLIVLDVYMPGYSGLEVCQRLKEAQETARVPVLLTVGKLEPFKPEEAKRARADGFIVKPFEASELLSALSKLEDKIVPRGETSKPGRFARATAALDEGRYDKSVAIDEDSGWKNRISFPSKKKGPAVQEDGDDPAVYNAMNKDLRTVVERKPVEPSHEAKEKEAEARVDLGALAPEGLPKDVTPEEIAALAAAAAQVKGKIAESQPEAEVKTEQHAQAAQPAQPALDSVPEVPAVPAPAATFAEQKSEDKIEVPAEKSSEPAQEAASIVAPSPADVMAAITSIEAEAAASHGTSSGNGSWLQSAPSHTSDEPVTMAAAAGAQSSTVVSRWTAVSVAPAPEEAAISLEHEMQKAYAAFAAAETSHAAASAPRPEIQPAAMEMSSPAAVAATEPVVPVPATPAPEAVQTLSEVANAATDAISAAVKELEAVAASYEHQIAPAPTVPTPAAQEPAPIEKTTAAAIVEPSPVAPAEETAPPASETPQPEVAQVAPEEPKAEASATTVPTPVEEVRAEESSAANVSEVSAPATSQAAAEQTSDAVHGESDASQSTAAAWASWHRTRESGAPSAPAAEPAQKDVEHEASAPEDAAARAVAAGAEKTPEEAATQPESDEGIASIVDSVLADLRPKIYEEISRKMGKKK
jgi:two-component system, chemotaxis family, chemotaxis protein CheY